MTTETKQMLKEASIVIIPLWVLSFGLLAYVLFNA